MMGEQKTRTRVVKTTTETTWEEYQVWVEYEGPGGEWQTKRIVQVAPTKTTHECS